MRSTTRQKLVKRLFPTAAHLSPISLMELTHLLFQLVLSPYRRLCICAFLGRPLMTDLRNSTAALSNERTNLTGNYARSLVGEPSSNKKLHSAFREDAHPHNPRARFCYPFHQLPQLVIPTQAGAERAGRSRSPRRDAHMGRVLWPVRVSWRGAPSAQKTRVPSGRNAPLYHTGTTHYSPLYPIMSIIAHL
jgi:hypothetical protein